VARTSADVATGRLRVAAVVRGAVGSNPKFGTKYSGLLAALADEGHMIEPYDATMPPLMRAVDAVLAFQPNLGRWRRSLRNNAFAFRRRSHLISRRLRAARQRTDVVLQVGGVFDARWDERQAPSVIYTDYTARMAAERPLGRRTPRDVERWVQLERRAYERAHTLCVRSKMVRDSLVMQYGTPAGRVHVVGGGANVDGLPSCRPSVGHNPPTALFIGRDFMRKGGDLVLEAFAVARRTIPNARLLFATRRPIPGRFPTAGVVSVPPAWDRERMMRLYAQADFLVLPARLETWGDVLLESMAHGLPCIGVRGEPMQEIIRHRIDGALIPAGDVARLAVWMRRLLGDVERCRDWGASAQRRVARQFLWRHVAQRISPLLEAAAESAR